jgi:hypothetical protein
VPKPEQPDQVLIATDQAQALFKDFHEWYRFYIEQASLQIDKAFEVNKQIASSYERLLLIDVGTIGLSITAFITLAGKFSSHVSRYPFVWLIGTAWGLMFIAAVFFSSAITLTISANASIYKQWTGLLQTYNSQKISTAVIRLSKALSGSVRVGEEDHDVQELFAKLGAKIREEAGVAEAERLRVIQAAIAAQSPAARMARLAKVSMQLGFVLLCIAAIKGFLAV